MLIVLHHFNGYFVYYIAPTVRFEQPIYNVNENDTLQLVLILSNPSSSNVSVQVFTIDGSATGEY